MVYCRECGGKCTTKKIIKGSIRSPRVDRVTCTECGFEESRESAYKEEVNDRQEVELRKNLKEEQYKLKIEQLNNYD